MLDTELVEQALQGLIVNAIEASHEGGRITLRVTCENKNVEIHILDEGAGMPFEPSATNLAPGPTTKRFGTGLGIPFALRVMEEHGGAIRFEARKPKGTAVIVSLPKKQPEGKDVVSEYY